MYEDQLLTLHFNLYRNIPLSFQSYTITGIPQIGRFQ